MRRALTVACAGSAAIAAPIALAFSRAYPPTPSRHERFASLVAEHLGWVELRNGMDDAGTE